MDSRAAGLVGYVDYVIDARDYWSTQRVTSTSQATAWIGKMFSGHSTNKTRWQLYWHLRFSFVELVARRLKITGWLLLSECNTSLLWRSIVVFATEFYGTLPTTVCQSSKLLVASICDLPDVINCQFCEFAAALLGPVYFLLLDQQSGIHCLITCAMQLLTPNHLGDNLRRICSPDIRNVSRGVT